jgi:hypothetical protein
MEIFDILFMFALCARLKKKQPHSQGSKRSVEIDRVPQNIPEK